MGKNLERKSLNQLQVIVFTIFFSIPVFYGIITIFVVGQKPISYFVSEIMNLEPIYYNPLIDIIFSIVLVICSLWIASKFSKKFVIWYQSYGDSEK